MSIDCPRIDCKFHNDPRLFVGVATIVAHAAAHAGLEKRQQEGLADATIKACEKGLCRCAAGSNGDSVVRMGIASFPDRVEVNLEFPEDDTLHQGAGLKNGRPEVKLVQYRQTEKSRPAQ
jgi:hypothetical protein